MSMSMPLFLSVTPHQIYASAPTSTPASLSLVHCHHSDAMAETPGNNHLELPDEPLEALEEPHQVHLNSPARTSADSPDRSAREATELARIRSNYTRASSYHHAGSSTGSPKPDGLLERFNDTIRTFWRRQISITVAHSTCRDHLVWENTPDHAPCHVVPCLPAVAAVPGILYGHPILMNVTNSTHSFGTHISWLLEDFSCPVDARHCSGSIIASTLQH
ncbi:hypothetical protein ONS96_010155 [Cadophora gregata f. sp. sojae]|nr:hypothetical protein ONS96_010155 [Cadophora gregata f. sp. sojae]